MLSACATSGSGRSFGRAPLPTLAQVQALAQRSVSIAPVTIPSTTVLTWDLAGPLPISLNVGHTPSRWNANNPAEQALSELLAGRDVQPSEGMRCYARELAGYYARYRSQPMPSLQRFMATACRVQANALESVIFTLDLDAAMTETQVARQVRQLVSRRFGDFVTRARGLTGIATAREGNTLVILAIAAPPTVRIEQETPSSDGSVIVRGEALDTTEEDTLYVTSNQLDGGAKLCTHMEGSRAPRFIVRCVVPTVGAPTMISINKIPHRSILGREVGEAFIGGNEQATRWQLTQYPEVRWSNENTTRAQLGQLLNTIRAAARRRPLVFAPEAEAIACALAPHLFEGHAANENEPDSDLVQGASLGMMAGFGVPRLVRSGLVGAAGTPSLDAAVILSTALERPGARLTLMDRQARYGAVCPIHTANGFAGIAYVTWRTVRTRTMHETASIWAQIQEQRAQRGVPALQQWEGVPRAAANAISAIDSGVMSPDEALDAALNAGLQELGPAGVQGIRAQMFAAFSTGNGGFDVPDALLDRGLTQAQIVSTWYRAPESAWAVRLFLVFSPGDATSPVTH